MTNEIVDHLEVLRAYRKVALAVSGGRDSIALLRLAVCARDRFADFPDLIVYTVDHGLRAEAAAEARQVAGWSEASGIACRILTRASGIPSGNLQAAAREARYRLMAEAAEEDGVSALVTAHHQEDQAETLLLRLARGSGLRGLAAMPAVGKMHGLTILRPFLDVPRQRLVQILEDAGHSWIDDPSNDDARFDRVRFRTLLPVLEEAGLPPDRLARATEALRRGQDAIDHYAHLALDRWTQRYPSGFARLDWAGLSGEPEEVRLRVLATLIEGVTGCGYAPRLERLERMAAALSQSGDRPAVAGTLAGCIFERFGSTVWIYREAGRSGFPDLSLGAGEKLVWDDRFIVETGLVAAPDARIRALGHSGRAAAAPFFAREIPAKAIESVPAVFVGGQIIRIAGGFTPNRSKHCEWATIRPIHPDMDPDTRRMRSV
ncbi:MAG: tRNA lysidine(34) synthetase TilS [Pseudomonadota bacterium]